MNHLNKYEGGNAVPMAILSSLRKKLSIMRVMPGDPLDVTIPRFISVTKS